MARARKKTTSRKRTTRSKSSAKNRKGSSPRGGFPLGRILLVLAVMAGAYLVYLDATVRSQFEGKRWALPAKVYARPLELYTGLTLSSQAFAEELELLGYRKRAALRQPGDISRDQGRFHLYTRAFTFWDGAETSRRIRIDISQGRVAGLSDIGTGQPLDLVRLEPLQIASIYPSHHEDRELVRLDQVPPLLLQTLIAVEDRNFYQHHGISLRGIARAMLANIKAGGLVQGGSTLTQQLVKNFFLTQDRTLVRKINEAFMALLLELHYSKEQILEAYLNEVFLGQDGARAIHGFGLASQFYFERPVAQLNPAQLALLVGMVKGPTLYDPRRHPERALERRNLVLELLQEQNLLTAAQARTYKGQSLGIVERRRMANNAYPAFLDLVRRQLQRDYREEDLKSEGLRIFTSLDPITQRQTEQVLAARLAQLETQRGLPADSLQAAMLVSRAEDGEVLAVVGGRDPQQAGFNRALDARRPIGSLIKPVVYLTALEAGYNLATMLEDSPYTWRDPGGEVWEPSNYDGKFRGPVMLHDALVHSLNVPTAKLGMAVGLDNVGDTLARLGVADAWPNYPSALLGAFELSPLQVMRFYQTFAAQGYRSPLRAIRAVLGPDGTPLQRYPLAVERIVTADNMYLLNTALQDVAHEGTARSLVYRLGEDVVVAGKTGTTDDLRDSWFAGFDADHLAVAWIGRDDNQPMELTGSQGALQLWADWMTRAGPQSIHMAQPQKVQWRWVDPQTGMLADRGCEGARELPFIEDRIPTQTAPCAGQSGPGGWLRQLFD